jgi:hypothetical protein
MIPEPDKECYLIIATGMGPREVHVHASQDLIVRLCRGLREEEKLVRTRAGRVYTTFMTPGYCDGEEVICRHGGHLNIPARPLIPRLLQKDHSYLQRLRNRSRRIARHLVASHRHQLAFAYYKVMSAAITAEYFHSEYAQ